MGIEGIIEKIRSDADREIAELERVNKEKIAALLDGENKYREKTVADAHSRATVESAKKFDQTFNREEANLRKELLEAKRKLIGEVFDKSYPAILALSPENLQDKYAEIVASFGEKSGEIVVGKEDKNLLADGFMKLLSQKIAGSNFTRSVSDSFDKGLVLVVGRIQYDAKLSSLFSELKEKTTDEVANALFSS
jgi:vacuolar-type H+-ATPase subunit E/Vma4